MRHNENLVIRFVVPDPILKKGARGLDVSSSQKRVGFPLPTVGHY